MSMMVTFTTEFEILRCYKIKSLFIIISVSSLFTAVFLGLILVFVGFLTLYIWMKRIKRENESEGTYLLQDKEKKPDDSKFT